MSKKTADIAELLNQLTEEGVEGIVFFDGVCNLCNFWVSFLVNRDKHRKLRYASLQSPLASRLLKEPDPLVYDTVVYYDVITREKLTKSDAALQAMEQLPLPWRMGAVCKNSPAPLRDMVYRAIAKIRYPLFGKKDTCRIPTPEERHLFLD